MSVRSHANLIKKMQAFNWLFSGPINPVQPKVGRAFPARSVPGGGSDGLDWQAFQEKVQSNAEKIVKQVGINVTSMYGTAKQQIDRLLETIRRRD